MNPIQKIITLLTSLIGRISQKAQGEMSAVSQGLQILQGKSFIVRGDSQMITTEIEVREFLTERVGCKPLDSGTPDIEVLVSDSYIEARIGDRVIVSTIYPNIEHSLKLFAYHLAKAYSVAA